jgi:putative ABC transport system permease protein
MMEFLTESFLISGIGSLAGLVFGVLFSILGCTAIGMTPLLNQGMILFSVLFATGIGVVFGVYPAMQAAKLRPVDALRSEI